jgi:hypothetical protein
MPTFKNKVLHNDWDELSDKIDDVKISDDYLSGKSLDIITKDPLTINSYYYKGKTADDDLEHDFLTIKKI